MQDAFEDLPEVLALSAVPIDEGPAFRHADALRVIDACTESLIAVEGVFVVEQGSDSHRWGSIDYSEYEVQYLDPRSESEWPRYVRENNQRAAAFLVERGAVADELHQLMTVTWPDYEEARARRLAFDEASSLDEPVGPWWTMAGHAILWVGLLLSFFLVAGVGFISPALNRWLLWPRALVLAFLIVVPGGLVLRETWKYRRDDKGSVAFVLFMMVIFTYVAWAILAGPTPIQR